MTLKAERIGGSGEHDVAWVAVTIHRSSRRREDVDSPLSIGTGSSRVGPEHGGSRPCV